MLERGDGVVGHGFRGAIQIGAYRYLARADGAHVGYVDCGTCDCSVVYASKGSEGPIVTESIETATRSIAFVIDPQSGVAVWDAR